MLFRQTGTLQLVEHSNRRRMKSYSMCRKKRHRNFECSNLIGRNQFIPLRHTMLAKLNVFDELNRHPDKRELFNSSNIQIVEHVLI